MLNSCLDCENNMAGVGNLLKSIGKQLDVPEVKEIQYLMKSTLSG